jgi:hypothetical protein
MDYIPASKVEPRKADPDRYCDVCKEPFLRRFNEKRDRFLIRKTCDKRTCRAAIVSPPRPCAVCKAFFARRPGEAHADFALRKTCGGDCRGQLSGLSREGKARGNQAGRHRARDISRPRPEAPAVSLAPSRGWWDLPTREGCPVAAIYREWVERWAVGAVADIPDDEGEDPVPLEAAS